MAFSWAHGITGQPVKSNHVGEEIYINQPFPEQLRPNDIHRLRVDSKTVCWIFIGAEVFLTS